MTKERDSATEEARPAERVTTWENESVKGHALCAGYLFQEHIEKAEKLRQQQAEYRASLPTEPQEAIRAAVDLMCPGSNSYPAGIEEALHLSCALESMVKEGEWINRESSIYIAARVHDAILRAADSLDRVSDILGNPRRVARGL